MTNVIVTAFSRLTALISAFLLGFMPFYQAGLQRLELDRLAQLEHISSLENLYASGEYIPCDEAEIVDGDLEAALEAGIKYNELCFIATHNSYQTSSTDEIKEIYSVLDTLTAGLINKKTADYDSACLSEQLNSGIRSIELDVEAVRDDSTTVFRCMHSPSLDMTTNCYDLELAFKEIAMWSDNNSEHLPISIIIEPKKIFLPLENMEFFTLDSAEALDALLVEVFGEKLFTPAEMLGDFSSFAEMRAADGWCEVKDMLGRVVVLLHDTLITNKYIALDSSIKTQAMFPMLRYSDRNKSFASFLLVNKPERALSYSQELIDEGRFIVRTRIDTFASVSASDRESAMESGAQLLSSDYPPVKDRLCEYFVAFDDLKTVKISKR